MTDPKRPEDEVVDEVDETLDAEPTEPAMADEPSAEDFDDEEDAELEAEQAQEAEQAALAATAAEVAASAPKPSPLKGAKSPSTVQTTDELPYVDDRVSKFWVALIALTFLAILLYGLFLGSGGFLNPPTPVPTEAPPSPTLSTSPAPTGTPRASVTPAATGTPGASGTPAATGTPAASPSAAPSPTPTAGTT